MKSVFYYSYFIENSTQVGMKHVFQIWCIVLLYVCVYSTFFICFAGNQP